MENRLDTSASCPESTAARQPHPWRAAGWLCVLTALYFLGVFFYIAGYGAYLGVQASKRGELLDPIAVQSAVEAHMQTPGAMAGVYMVQFFLMLPVLLLAADFKGQSRWNTLALQPFAPGVLGRWCLLLAVFLVAQIAVVGLLGIEPSEFMQSLAGSRHLPLTLVVVLAAPLLEELVFRGYLFTAWRHSRLGFSGTLLLTSTLFALWHWGQYHWVQTAFIFILALILGYAREKSGSVLLPMLLHSLNNLVSAIVVIYLGVL